MAALTLLVLSLIAFSLSARGLFLSLTENVTIKSLTGGYSRTALKISKIYKVLAWGLLTVFLLTSAVNAFLTFFLQLS